MNAVNCELLLGGTLDVWRSVASTKSDIFGLCVLIYPGKYWTAEIIEGIRISQAGLKHERDSVNSKRNLSRALKRGIGPL